MYAIIEDGSRQYRAEPDGFVTIDYRDVKPGDTIELGKVLLLNTGSETLIGRPLLAGARVVAEVAELTKIKSVIQKFRRRKNYRRLKGHTQHYVKCRIKHILGAGQQPPTEEPKPTPTATA